LQGGVVQIQAHVNCIVNHSLGFLFAFGSAGRMLCRHQ
jgi:hypothetical protein